MKINYLLLLCCIIIISCQKPVKDFVFRGELATGSFQTLETMSVGVCDYNLDESILTSSGWTKRWEDDFTGSLDKWNIWTGGAYNNELQYYQATNLELSGGILSMVAKRENKTGATLPSDPTPKEFAFTSGRIEGKTHFSASTATPKVRMIARLKLPTGYGMWPAFWSYGDPWPTQGEIDIMEARAMNPSNTRLPIGMDEGPVSIQQATQKGMSHLMSVSPIAGMYMK
jgi:hypothetical protein